MGSLDQANLWRQAPESLVAGLATTSDKIRTLFKAGYSRSEISKFLNIRYQHVRNVLVRDGFLGTRIDAARPQPDAPAGRTLQDPTQIRVKVGPGGRICIPVPFRNALGIDEGSVVFVRREGEELHLVSDAIELRRIRATLNQHVPDGVSLVDELLRERRREVGRRGHG